MNVELVKEIIGELLIDDGRELVNGRLDDLKREQSPNAVRLRTPDELSESLSGVIGIEQRDGAQLIRLEGEPQAFLETLLGRGVQVERFELERLPLSELFVKAVREKQRA